MPAHFNPEFDPADVNTDYGQTGGDITVPTFTADYSPFKFWCQKTLPLVFDDSLSYYEVLCKLVNYVNNLLTDLQTATGSIGTFAQQFVVNQQFLNQMAEQLGTNTAQLESYINDRMDDFSEAYASLQEYVNTYFANLDVQEEINTKLDEMAQDGTLDTLLQPFTEDWLENMTEEIRTDLANQNQTLTNQNARISVLEGRMNTFSTLPAGSTSANAELVDIRTNFLGETYANAGEAVRASDLIASGYYPLMYSGHKDDWYLSGDGAAMDDACNTLSFDITKYKGGKLAYIFNIEHNLYEYYEMGTLNIIGKGSTIIPDSTMTEMEIFPANGYLTLLRNYTDSGSVVGQRLLFIRDIPEDETEQYYYLPYTDFQNQIPGERPPEHLAPTGCVFPNYMLYVTNWTKTPVDDTLTQAGEAADAKATGDAIAEINERIGVLSLGTLQPGYFSGSGQIIEQSPTNQEMYGENYIGVSPGQTLTFSMIFNSSHATWMRVCEYNANKVFIRQYTPNPPQVSTAKREESFTIGEKTRFIRISFRSFNDLEEYILSFNNVVQALSISAGNNKPEIMHNENCLYISHQGYDPNSTGTNSGHNKLSGYIAAKEHGFDYGETDVQFSSDNVPLCCHDASFVDGNTSQTIVIAEHTLTELKTYNYYGTTIATLEEVVKTCKNIGLPLALDQIASKTSEQIAIVINIIKKYGMNDKIMWLCAVRNDDFIDSILTYNPKAKFEIIQTTGVTAAALIALANSKINNNNMIYVGLNYSQIAYDDIPALNATLDSRCKIAVWTIPEWIPTCINYMQYVGAITSNRTCYNDVYNYGIS